MSCSAKFSMTLQTEILSTETSDFLNQIIFLKSFKVSVRRESFLELAFALTEDKAISKWTIL